ncbi:hypothetical protein Trichorick_01381 (plasmid) [Candidatus Trichorickettsia mobilis]|uniref:Uncharacterized protein n=1 Tax=Candidatus Trichorickettsia mobilis TaxID=1346319 RepID=A0ABZ0UUY6_9RICK|nr:hypothetical protein Trichorick_01381 [Candidatus Trichorickettsia mobilis]
MTIHDLLLTVLFLSQTINFFLLLRLDNKLTLLIEEMNKNQEKSNEYLKVIAEQHGYR